MSSILDVGGINVFGDEAFDGGGQSFGLDFIPIVKARVGKVGRACEFFSGFGFIGFSLLANNLCESLCLVDISRERLALAKKTVTENNLEDRVSIYESDCFDNIPGGEKWDLVVGNPPHVFGTLEQHLETPSLYDPNWSIHRRFYRDVHMFLNEGASVILCENGQESSTKTFSQMIKDGRLTLVESFKPRKTNLKHLGRFVRSGAFLRPRRLATAITIVDYRYYFIHSKWLGDTK